MYDIFDINSFEYGQTNATYSRNEFLITGPHIPLRPPDPNTTTITSLLPEEGLNIPFTVSDGQLIFDTKWHGWVASIYQASSSVNGAFINAYIGNKLYVSNRAAYSILDGGYVHLTTEGDLTLSPGIVLFGGVTYRFCGLKWTLSDQILTLPLNRGLSFALFVVSPSDKKGSYTTVEVVQTDLISKQIGDYSTLYAVIRSKFGVDYTNIKYVELYRGQFISQSPSTPFIRGHVDSRYREPVVDNYSIYSQ
jgi:hypothetical protein